MVDQTAISPQTEHTSAHASQQMESLSEITPFRPTIIQSYFRRSMANMFIRVKELFILASCLRNPVKIYCALQKIRHQDIVLWAE